jgi:TPR repeat protein
MADGHKLPAEITGRALAPAEQSGSLVARGLEAIKNRQRTLVTVGVEAEKSFREHVEAVMRGDFAEAVKWYHKAAEQGLDFVQFKLGVMYANGQGVPQDYAAAVRWYRLAADQGYAAAHPISG